MSKLIDAVKGYKTYGVLGIAAIIWFLEATAIIGAGTLESLTPILALLGGATVTAKINRMMN